MSGPGPDGPSEQPHDERSSEPEATTEPREDADADRSRPGKGDRAANGGGDPVTNGRSATSEPDSDGRSPPPQRRSATDHESLEPTETPIRWFLRTDDGTVVAIRDVLSSVAIVALIGLVLFGISGIWPPMVAVESGSMEPNMERGDLIFITAPDRFVGDDPIGGTGVVAADTGADDSHEKFGQAGDVIVFKPGGSEFRTPVIHRAHFWVEPGENWVAEKADPDYLSGATTCEEVRACPASHAGFVTKGDANSGYDQANAGARTDVVRPAWIEGKAMFRIPWLGHVRLAFDDLLATGPVGPVGDSSAKTAPVKAVPIGVATADDSPTLRTTATASANDASVGPAGAATAGVAAAGALTVLRRRARG